MHLIGILFEKVIFWTFLKSKSLYFLDMVIYVYYYKYLRSRLTWEPLGKHGDSVLLKLFLSDTLIQDGRHCNRLIIYLDIFQMTSEPYVDCGNMKIQNCYNMGLGARKPVFSGWRTTKAQTSLGIPAVWSAPLLFAYWKVSYLNLLQAKFQFSSKETGLKMALSDTLKTGFLATRPMISLIQVSDSGRPLGPLYM